MLKKIDMCNDVKKVNEGDDFNEVHDVYWRVKNKKLIFKNELVEKIKNMDEEFERNFSLKQQVVIEMDVIV